MNPRGDDDAAAESMFNEILHEVMEQPLGRAVDEIRKVTGELTDQMTALLQKNERAGSQIDALLEWSQNHSTVQTQLTEDTRDALCRLVQLEAAHQQFEIRLRRWMLTAVAILVAVGLGTPALTVLTLTVLGR